MDVDTIHYHYWDDHSNDILDRYTSYIKVCYITAILLFILIYYYYILHKNGQDSNSNRQSLWF